MKYTKKKGQKHNKSIKGGNKNYVWLLCCVSEWKLFKYNKKYNKNYKGNSSIAYFQFSSTHFSSFFFAFVMNQNRQQHKKCARMSDGNKEIKTTN